MTREELRKEATMTVEWECTPMIDRPLFIHAYITGAEPREKRIAELEKENAELRYLANEKCAEQLTKAKEIIKDYLTIVKGSHTTVCGVPEENRTIYVLKLNKEAEQFLNEVEKPIESSVDYIIEQNEKEVV